MTPKTREAEKQIERILQQLEVDECYQVCSIELMHDDITIVEAGQRIFMNRIAIGTRIPILNKWPSYHKEDAENVLQRLKS